MSKTPIQIYVAYQEAKDEFVEKTVGTVEVKSSPLFFILFLLLTFLCWLSAIFSFEGLNQLYQAEITYYVFSFFFVSSYFFFYLGSKFVFRPSKEELTDDTSIFAIFSACDRKANRSLISIGISFLHTMVFVLYLVNKDLNLLDGFQ